MPRLKEDIPAFRSRLRELVGSKTRGEFAKICEISPQALGYYLSGERVPDAVILRRIAVKNHVSVDWLLGLSDMKTSDQTVRSIAASMELSEETITRYFMWRKEAPAISSHIIDILSTSNSFLCLINEYIYLYLSSWYDAFKGSEEDEDEDKTTSDSLPENNQVPKFKFDPAKRISLYKSIIDDIEFFTRSIVNEVLKVAYVDSSLAEEVLKSEAKFNMDDLLNGNYSEYYSIGDIHRLLYGGIMSSAEKLRLEAYFTDHDINSFRQADIKGILDYGPKDEFYTMFLQENIDQSKQDHN